VLLLTGATGFVGRALIRRFVTDGVEMRAAVRVPSPVVHVPQVVVSDLSKGTDWSAAIAKVGVVVHSAARVHVMRETAPDPLAEFRRVNVDGTIRLAEQAASAGVRRFVFISSIKVNGETTLPGRPFTESDQPAPADPYGVSKHEAEQALFTLGVATGMEVVVVRPVLVYGPGVKGNFRRMLQWVARGVPLPFGAVENKRSLVAVANLVDLIATCVRHPAAAGEVFFVSDGEDLSTPDLLRRTGVALGRPVRLIPVPPMLLRGGAALLGKGDFGRRILGSLQVDITKAGTLLGWSPPESIEAGLRAAVAEA
jgi:nucleoside-diphosphate-sugar epimerase